MEQFELLRYLVEVMERLGIRYFFTGSVVSVFYGEPRFTNDIDIVADLQPANVPPFCQAFSSPEYYLSEDAIRQAICSRGQFNIIHPTSGLKVDVILPTQSEHDRSRFARIARVHPEPDYEAAFSSIEDVIIKKMEFYQIGGSEKHLRDIASALKISGDKVDRAYISAWAAKLGLADIWQSIKARDKPQ